MFLNSGPQGTTDTARESRGVGTLSVVVVFRGGGSLVVRTPHEAAQITPALNTSVDCTDAVLAIGRSGVCE